MLIDRKTFIYLSVMTESENAPCALHVYVYLFISAASRPQRVPRFQTSWASAAPRASAASAVPSGMEGDAG